MASLYLLVALCFYGIFALDITCLMTIILALKHAEDIGSSAECSSDDEDLEECETSHTGGLG